MTTPLLITLVLLALYGLYFAARVARTDADPGTFLDAGQALPGWSVMFLLPGIVMAGYGIDRHLFLVGRFGLQATHVTVGFVLVAIAALLVFNRLWLATRVANLYTPGEALGRYYGSVALRVAVMALGLLFALPFAADLLSSAARILEAATDGIIPRVAGVWLIAFSLAIPAIVGGWRATVLVLAMESILLAVLLPGVAVFTEMTSQGDGFPSLPIQVADGVLWDRIPGVLQNSAGIGKSVPSGGIFTAVGIASTVIAAIGIIFSPATLYLGQTVRAGRAFGVSTVWMTGGFATGAMVLAVPLLVARMPDGSVALADDLFAIEPLAGVGLLLLNLVGALLAVSFFVTGGAVLVTRELLFAYLLPSLSDRQQRLAARIALGFAYFIMALMAAFSPFVSAVAASVALPLSVQMLPAILGLTFFRWISRGAVLAGMTIGVLIVVFTEPLGLILFEALFVELPWGRWPLTIHSAVWGLAFNVSFVLLASGVTLRAPDRLERDRLHDAMATHQMNNAGGRGLLWTLMLLWGFLAYGPGAILGNTFFSRPIFTKVEAGLGVPSLWVWQILFWLFGVVLVWWLAYRVGFGQTSEDGIKPIQLGEARAKRTPDWLAAGLARVAERPARLGARRYSAEPAKGYAKRAERSG
ncbi:hypothetical protein FGK63_18460 [Ruegeria sediminis]|uniref:Sodium:solute symporter n=1 Tax=Ruegeria sediminis TaxID=2583820 RepID=A0ABY2WT87_9RHOB|nr:hypothetical protein [Ruegeria sediminis]TMV04268.1 hypothetical protein FGK63_18460 [Ruegeria sediminis]